MNTKRLSVSMRDLDLDKRIELLKELVEVQRMELSHEEFRDWAAFTGWQEKDVVKKRKKRESAEYIPMTNKEILEDKIRRTESKIERSMTINEMEKWSNELINLNSKYISKYIKAC